jgi:hypothetical protein
MEIQAQRFGIEIEMTGLTRGEAAEVVARHFGAAINHYGGGYDEYSALDTQERKWKLVSDASINGQVKRGRQIENISDAAYRVELVSPICRYEDIPDIQQITRDLRAAGMLVNASTGIHVHVDASPFDAGSLRNITNIMAAKEDLIYKSLQVDVARERQYCHKTDTRWLEELNRRKPKTLDAVSRIWYEGNSGRSQAHYDRSRYHCLNLHSLFNKGTIEFRLFNGTTHAGKIKAYIQLALAITAQALNQRCASRRRTESTNEKYTFRTWLLRLGLIGDEFASARQHLLEHLEGCIAWKDPVQAEAQKERLRQKREKERETEQTASVPETAVPVQDTDGREMHEVPEEGPERSMTMRM